MVYPREESQRAVPPFLRITYKWARCCAISLVGGTVLLVGILMIVFPGPAIVVIPAGLAILGLEFAWAKHWLHKVKATGNLMMNSASAYWNRDKSGYTDKTGYTEESKEERR
ncbi:PGPGW domain-containing protein [Povalibacter sp.]|uniref:PGPGW domain-containing protein n=1 Tax=Povalibacter sp. TaxID=1962978 RepID=UPI002F401796